MAENFTIITGDSLSELKKMPNQSVHMCVTSPPYFGLRDYGVQGQLGLETDYQEYVRNLVAVFSEVKRVLRDDGTLWLNLGDSYAGSGRGMMGDGSICKFAEDSKQRTNAGTTFGRLSVRTDKLKPKNLYGIPWRVAFALQDDGWILRQDIIWQKTNPMTESVKDRCTRAHEYLFLFAKNPKYYFNAQAIREPLKESTLKRYQYGWNGRDDDNSGGSRTGSAFKKMKEGMSMGEAMGNDGKKNKRSVWSISTQSFKGAHFATFPEKLVEPCILAGCPDGGTVLDPFAGSGTTGVVSLRNGKKFVGIELNPEYVEICNKRISDSIKQ